MIMAFIILRALPARRNLCLASSAALEKLCDLSLAGLARVITGMMVRCEKMLKASGFLNALSAKPIKPTQEKLTPKTALNRVGFVENALDQLQTLQLARSAGCITSSANRLTTEASSGN